MALTPVEIRHLTPGRGLFGYKSGPTDRLLEEIAASFEDVWRERADLADRVEQLEADLVRYRELEALLRTTLVSAERASGDSEGAGAPRGGADPQRGACRGAGRPAAARSPRTSVWRRSRSGCACSSRRPSRRSTSLPRPRRPQRPLPNHRPMLPSRILSASSREATSRRDTEPTGTASRAVSRSPDADAA